jgi:hypothetical protein
VATGERAEAEPYAPGVGVWLLASLLFGRDVPGDEPYPCLCASSFGCELLRNPQHCVCFGRTDVDHLRRRCCAVRRAGIRRVSRED